MEDVERASPVNGIVTRSAKNPDIFQKFFTPVVIPDVVKVERPSGWADGALPSVPLQREPGKIVPVLRVRVWLPLVAW
jgi:hypothetical protein